jgi:hypothetical protein
LIEWRFNDIRYGKAGEADRRGPAGRRHLRNTPTEAQTYVVSAAHVAHAAHIQWVQDFNSIAASRG